MEKAREFQKNIYFLFIDYAKVVDCVNDNKHRKVLKEMGIPDYLTCLLRNLYVRQEATERTGHGTMDWFKIGKGVWQGCILSPCLFNFYAEYIMPNAKLDGSQTGIKDISTTSAMTNLDSILKIPFCWPRAVWSKLSFFQQSYTDVSFGP